MSTPAVNPGVSAVNSAAMAHAVTEVANAAASAESIRGTLQNQMNELAPSWRSDAANVFMTAMGQWDTEFATVLSALREIEETLAATLKRYNVNVSVTTDTVGGFAAQLNG
ncbi:WXG100 family type VII secretion target [Catenulispora sp. NF23]|uniref:ESAT-6-like protein n=1 Tax=Catenulispora pinistramenti TaxID=2705254 RepID=A0ABS5KGU8_9ACTN|nr:WXG100 family type VII secretion target [Catenulispora pinistramenti]MBS2540040.1 WXG100 family type VII secretion target [Catenulispora pinistramenti]MBS2545242.1 WXG100 family type VII secretion target [Catenulispora pinistramenti]